MPRLLLLRHAQAEPPDPRRSDHDRALDERGRAEAATIGAAMRAAGFAAAAILVSSARRTLETLRLALPDRSDARVLDTLYLADADALLESLRGLEDAESALLIGHNPGLHQLALHLGPAVAALRHGLPTAGLAAFALRGAWAGLGPGAVRFDRLLSPADPAGS